MRSFTLVVAATLLACSSETSAPTSDGGASTDVGAEASSDVHVGEAATGAACTFNRECSAIDRCECIDSLCTCRTGARGTGKTGIDTCTSGNDCASSLCVEGSDGKDYCSDECVTDASCGGSLPRCLDVAGLGRICVRRP